MASYAGGRVPAPCARLPLRTLRKPWRALRQPARRLQASVWRLVTAHERTACAVLAPLPPTHAHAAHQHTLLAHSAHTCSAKNLANNEKVAIKKIANAFENLTDARRTLREIKLLRHLRHENIIAVKDILRPPAKDKFNDVYLVYELMDTDLHQIIRSSQPLTNEHFQYFVYQVRRRGGEPWRVGGGAGCGVSGAGN